MPSEAPFNPAPALSDALLASLADPFTSLTDLAAAHNTSLEALSLWIARPAIAERLAAIHHIAAVRARFIAANFLAPALANLNQVLTRTRAQIDEDATAPPDKQRTLEQRQRTLETARRAAGRIISLANYNPISLFSPPRAAALAPRQTPIVITPAHPPAPPAPSTVVASSQSTAPTPGRNTHPRAATQQNPAPAPRNSSPLPPHLAARSQSTFPPRRSPAALLAQAGATSTSILDPPFEHWP